MCFGRQEYPILQNDTVDVLNCPQLVHEMKKIKLEFQITTILSPARNILVTLDRDCDTVVVKYNVAFLPFFTWLNYKMSPIRRNLLYAYTNIYNGANLNDKSAVFVFIA